MTYRMLLILNAFVAVLLGAAFLFVPSRVLNLFGTETFVATLLMSRFFGTAMLALGLLLWFAKDINEQTVQTGIGIALMVGAAAGLVVTLAGTFASNAVIRSNGWIVMLIYILFGLGYAYLVFAKRERAVSA
jgi:hypothetical protein